MRKIIAEKMSDEVANWSHSGLIDEKLFTLLKTRYTTDASLGGVLLRWLGFLAVYLLGMSIMGFIGISLGKVALYVAPFVVGALSFVMWKYGVKMASDSQQRYPMSGAVLVTAGLIGGFSALLSLYAAFGGGSMRYAPAIIMLMVAVAAFLTAYQYKLRWPLVLALLLVFHGLGNMHSYDGSGSYFLGVRDERLTFFIALISIIIGIWHERARERDGSNEIGFGQIYIVIGLIYANLCLWILSIAGTDLAFVLLFSAACIAQLIAGARFHDGRFIGFGIVFLSINLYTRMFEGFWDDISKGNFFLLSGLVALGIGAAFEIRSRNLKSDLGV
ncbi:hypothetical protein JYT12_01190 [Beggiatoa alba]|nr:hypothetical protein [Beggiatoa alba]